jgi:hypothetical protein
MHPEILRELSSQHGAEMRDQAHRTGLARMASRARRARRHGLSAADKFAAPAIPDFADGSFLVTPTEAAGAAGAAGAEAAGAAGGQPRRVPAARRAA